MLVLASGSPRRRELLLQIGEAFRVEAADVCEDQRAGEDAVGYALRLAEEKARAVWELRRGELDRAEDPLIVLGADTCVVCAGEVLGKPANAADAKRTLRLLRGRTHEVLTGIAVATRAGMLSEVETTEVTFGEIAESELEVYVASGEPYDKAGGYGIQGYAARWIPRIEGCYFNVMGLPLARVATLLGRARANAG